MKRCTACGMSKPLSEFYKHRGRKDGLTDWCKECAKAKAKTYADENREAVRASIPVIGGGGLAGLLCVAVIPH